MGMFDSFVFTCIFCGKEVYEQTKSGPCMMDTYKFNDPNLPTWVMESFNDSEIECYECGKRMRIKFDYEVVVKSKSIEPVDNLDYVQWTEEKRKKEKK